MLAVTAAEEQGEGCSAPKICGNLTISEPFWLPDWETGRSCGSLDFEVTCFKGTPIIRSVYGLKSGFAIINISYEERSLRVVDQHNQEALRASSNRCHIPSRNTSVKLTPPFKINPVFNMDLIFYNCTKPPAAHQDETLVEMRCGNESNAFVRAGGRYDGAGDGDYATEGCQATVVPVLGESSGEVDASNYEELISGGFLLTWQSPPAGTGSKRTGTKMIIIIGILKLSQSFLTQLFKSL